jgi:hypothetical protein
MTGVDSCDHNVGLHRETVPRVLTYFLILVVASAIALGASAVMSWASNRSPLWNMALGAVLAIVVFLGVLVFAYFFTRSSVGP